MDRNELIDSAIELARRFARKAFASHPDREELVEDAQSKAWEMAINAPPDAPAVQIARYAVRHVRKQRQFQWSIRSVDHPHNRESHERLPIDTADVGRVGEDPYLLTQAKVDVAGWFATLGTTKRTVAMLLASGHTPGEVAGLIGKSRARVSQLRDELRASWAEYCGE